MNACTQCGNQADVWDMTRARWLCLPCTVAIMLSPRRWQVSFHGEPASTVTAHTEAEALTLAGPGSTVELLADC
jgi:hypothetical protein